MRLVIFVFLGILFLNCKEVQSESSVNNAPESTAGVSQEFKARKISLFGQIRPGALPANLEMEVNQALERLEFVEPDTSLVRGTDLVIGLNGENGPVAIPIKYLSAHEVANIKVEEEALLVTWCPIVGTARVFDREVEGKTTFFDFGRAMRGNNLLFVDRNTNTVWNQLSGEGIAGQLEGKELTIVPSIQSTWDHWEQQHPDTRLLINRDNSNPVWPMFIEEVPYYNTWEPGDGPPGSYTRHNTGNLGFGISLKGKSVFFPLAKLQSQDSPLEYTLGESTMIIHYSKEGMTAWAENLDGQVLPGSIAYDWAWKTFYPATVVYKD
ncbi:Protein of unknown function [Robiginitalea myxolifaciens]|uniref:DUF3179 domain-containing protein n=1 Tax=Robiginitalea myxolifaciens TaxID=400055 RepID=A0A1I6HD64_9FLAO|nr:DUF3179 domain-containing (seleno)protein [Robiginitalea myxolifaciens]SFR52432.1 Protein of unknown function [Robiginitalea myxolifaciens]